MKYNEIKKMGISDNIENKVINMHANEFIQVRALCDEMMSNLCQAKALLEPISDDNFFERFEDEALRHYFYALDTIIECTLETKDEVCRVIDHWENEIRKGAR